MLLKQVLGNRKWIIFILLCYVVSACWIYSQLQSRYPIYAVSTKFYVGNDLVLDSSTVIPSYEGGTLVHNTEVLRMLAYLEHPFLLDAILKENHYPLEDLYAEWIENKGDLADAFYASIRLINVNNVPNVEFRIDVPKDRTIAVQLADWISVLLVDRYNQDLWEELDRQAMILDHNQIDSSLRQKIEMAKALYLARKPIIVGRRVYEDSSYNQDDLLRNSLMFLFLPWILVYVWIGVKEEYFKKG